jgi:predicted oxidoreductase
VLGRGLSPERFVALLDEFRQKVTRERLVARLNEVKQDELIDLVKIHAEVRARYVLAILDLAQANMTNVDAVVTEAKRYRVMAEEIEKGVAAIRAAVLAKEIPVPGLEYRDDFSPEVERALEEFMRLAQDSPDPFEW